VSLAENTGRSRVLNSVAECGCGQFNSSSVCAACDRHWEQHETYFESERERKENGLPYGMHRSSVWRPNIAVNQTALKY